MTLRGAGIAAEFQAIVEDYVRTALSAARGGASRAVAAAAAQ